MARAREAARRDIVTREGSMLLMQPDSESPARLIIKDEFDWDFN